MDMSLSKFQRMVKDREAWRAPFHGGSEESDTTERLNNNIVTDFLTFPLFFFLFPSPIFCHNTRTFTLIRLLKFCSVVLGHNLVFQALSKG